MDKKAAKEEEKQIRKGDKDDEQKMKEAKQACNNLINSNGNMNSVNNAIGGGELEITNE